MPVFRTPTVDAICYYVDSVKGIIPARIMQPFADNSVDMQLIDDNEIKTDLGGIAHSDGKEIGTWHWPAPFNHNYNPVPTR